MRQVSVCRSPREGPVCYMAASSRRVKEGKRRANSHRLWRARVPQTGKLDFDGFFFVGGVRGKFLQRTLSYGAKRLPFLALNRVYVLVISRVEVNKQCHDDPGMVQRPPPHTIRMFCRSELLTDIMSSMQRKKSKRTREYSSPWNRTWPFDVL